MLPWLLCGVLLLIILAQWLKARGVQRGLDEILSQIGERLGEDTNNLLFLSTRDRHVRRLASELNGQLKLLRAQRRKYQSGDLELKEAVTNISHDLRTPLTAICGYLQLLDREDLPEPAGRYLSLIGERVRTLRLLTEELFRYSVVLSTEEELHPEELSLNGALEEAIARALAERMGGAASASYSGGKLRVSVIFPKV